MTMRAVRINRRGGPEVMRVEDLPTVAPGDDQALIDVHVAGLNFIDIRERTGDFAGRSLPLTPGWEGAGTVVALGAAVKDLHVGDRVAWHWSPGSYATQLLASADGVVHLPDHLEMTVAAGAMLQGLTAHTLASWTYPLEPGMICLVQAAAGGVGGLLSQIAKARGARVIGAVSRPDKVDAARRAGADEVVVYTDQDLAKRVRQLTDGRGVDVVYDGVGKDTFRDGLDALRPGGCMVSYGQASGAVPPLDTHLLQEHGGRFLTRATFGHQITDRASLMKASKELFSWIASGELEVRVAETYPLEQAASAHRAMASRTTSGKLLLTTD